MFLSRCYITGILGAGTEAEEDKQSIDASIVVILIDGCLVVVFLGSMLS